MTAVFGRRCLAWLLDLAIFVAVIGAIFASLAQYVDVPPGLDETVVCDTLQRQDPDAAAGCVVVGDRAYVTSDADNGIQTIASFGYFAFFVLLQGVAGASPGKLLTGLRVVKPDGTRAGVGKSLVRTLLWVVDGAPWFVPGVGFITGLTTTGHRRVGDMAASTYVVRRSAVGTPIVTTAAVSGPGGATAWGAPPTSGGWDTPTPQWPQQPAPPVMPPSGPPTTTPPSPYPAPAPPGTPPWSAPVADPPPSLPTDTAPPMSAPAPEPWDAPPIPPEPDSWVPPAPAEPTWDDGWSTFSAAPVEPPPVEPPPVEPPPVIDPTADAPETGAVHPTPVDPDLTAPAPPTPFTAPGADSPPPLPTATGGSTADAPSHDRSAPADLPPPQWDVARGTYIQWDPGQQAWLQWDTVASRWKPIDT